MPITNDTAWCRNSHTGKDDHNKATGSKMKNGEISAEYSRGQSPKRGCEAQT